MKQPIPIFRGKIVEGGALKMPEPEKVAMKRWCQTFKADTYVDITVKKHRKDRTLKQNKYYWKVVVPILALHFGHDNPDDMHEDLKLEFNPVESKISPGKKIGGTTTKMSTVEFLASEDSYIERICRWAASEHEIYIPPPEKAE